MKNRYFYYEKLNFRLFSSRKPNFRSISIQNRNLESKNSIFLLKTPMLARIFQTFFWDFQHKCYFSALPTVSRMETVRLHEYGDMWRSVAGNIDFSPKVFTLKNFQVWALSILFGAIAGGNIVTTSMVCIRKLKTTPSYTNIVALTRKYSSRHKINQAPPTCDQNATSSSSSATSTRVPPPPTEKLHLH